MRPLSYVARAGLVRFVGFMISAVPVALLSHSYRDVSARFVCSVAIFVPGTLCYPSTRVASEAGPRALSSLVVGVLVRFLKVCGGCSSKVARGCPRLLTVPRGGVQVLGRGRVPVLRAYVLQRFPSVGAGALVRFRYSHFCGDE